MAALLPSLLIMALFFTTTSANPLMAPAFLWSDQRSFGLHSPGAVDYRVLSPQSLVETLMLKFGWSNLLCTNTEEDENVDMLIAFIGSQLRSEDIARDADATSDVLHVLKGAFFSSKYSMALPYISLQPERSGIASMLLSTIKDSCDLKARPGKILIVGPCFRQVLDSKWLFLAEDIELVESAEGIKELINSRKGSKARSETDMMIVCPASSFEHKVALSEGNVLELIILAVRQSGTSATFLYSSDFSDAGNFGAFRGRLLLSNSSSSNSTCDDICETIAGLYEGLMVAITLLIILISGLCCMLGIDTPKRFESSQDS